MKRWIVIVSLLLLINVTHAAVEEHSFSSVQQEQRYKHLIDELRCLVCQNQNLADSNAALAGDLRRQVYKMLQQGASDKEILDFMVNRYGDFVLYRPPLKSTTWLLWSGPFILLLIGATVVVIVARRRQAAGTTELTDEQRARIKQLLDQDDEDRS